MKKNKYISEFDEKIYSLIDQYQRGEISEKVLRIAMSILFNQYYPEKFSKMILNFNEPDDSKVFSANLKSVVRFYNGTS